MYITYLDHVPEVGGLRRGLTDDGACGPDDHHLGGWRDEVLVHDVHTDPRITLATTRIGVQFIGSKIYIPSIMMSNSTINLQYGLIIIYV